jgi:hypothetical protein
MEKYGVFSNQIWLSAMKRIISVQPPLIWSFVHEVVAMTDMTEPCPNNNNDLAIYQGSLYNVS